MECYLLEGYHKIEVVFGTSTAHSLGTTVLESKLESGIYNIQCDVTSHTPSQDKYHFILQNSNNKQKLIKITPKGSIKQKKHEMVH